MSDFLHEIIDQRHPMYRPSPEIIDPVSIVYSNSGDTDALGSSTLTPCTTHATPTVHQSSSCFPLRLGNGMPTMYFGRQIQGYQDIQKSGQLTSSTFGARRP